jgi:hypothetical protein
MGKGILQEAVHLTPARDAGEKFRIPGWDLKRAIIVIPSLNNEPQLHLEGFAFRCQNSHGMQRVPSTPRVTRTAAE